MKRLLIGLCTLLSLGSTQVWAQIEETVGPEAFSAAWWSTYQTEILLLTIGAVMVLLLGVLVVVYRMLVAMLKRLAIEAGKETEWQTPWQSFLSRMTQAVPIEQEGEIALHEYDGIVELDNKLPPWWVAMFYVTFFMGAGYMIYMYGFDGPTQAEEYQAEMARAEEEVNAYLASLEEVIDETNVYVLQDEARLAEAGEYFQKNCGACHGKQGQGLVGLGPNLTDDYWLHGGDIKSMFKTVKYGVKNTSMIAWGKQLTPSQMHAIVTYAYNLHGTHPATEREAEGDLFERNPADDYRPEDLESVEEPAAEEDAPATDKPMALLEP